ncbi:hypothetical protein RCO28_19340 [Streptomyces sp. LHD-70]|uniref:hypothetical protein n=1 Tax=Streptomyces sp. LHD-70 TaxID=3072140 RepID=UPI00280F71AD|nr:hypothetical protein [Streptomyces sp. LHD-70]MDQ8704627.1 hypothetical protein [Streptomyces sp. LHD-70]
MTQSGQGEEPQIPAARPAHEGVVLPADGGEPLVPGTYGDQAVPAGGTPWGQPWGPDVPQAGPSYGQNDGFAPGQAWGQDPQQQPYGMPQQPQQFPYDGTPPQYDAAQPQPSQPYEQYPPQQPAAPQPYAPQHQQPYAQDPQPYAQQPQPQAPQPQPQQLQQPQPSQQAPGLPPQQAALGLPPAEQPQAPQAPLGALPAQPQPQSGAALPEPHQAQSGAALPQPQQPPQSAPLPPPAQGGAPLPPADAEATQYLSAVPQNAQQTQGSQGGESNSPGPYGGSQGVQGTQGTQGGAPLPGALPPEAPAADATQFLGRQAMPQPPAAGGPDSEATQYIAPVPPAPASAPYGIRPGAPGDRQPPAEFDSLFRSEPAGAGGAGGAESTQQMPQFNQPPAQPQPGMGQGQYAGPPEPTSRRTGSKVPLFAAIGVAIAVLGVGAGALIAGGGEDEKDEPKNAAESQPAEQKPSPTTDPAEEQAVALDKLLAESNDSRTAVINSVKSIEACRNLGQAATDLRDAAKQRNGLVTRLAQLEVDELPDHATLTAALNKAWKASASADNHYAAWADQVAAKGKKGCVKGKARTTKSRAAGNTASGDATAAKKQAAPLWNTIAGQYGLTKHTWIQL